MLPDNYQKIFENSDVTVIRAHYGPHEKIPVHDHSSFATVFVYLSDSGPVRIDHQDEDGKIVPVTRPPTVLGSYRIAPGMAERHSIENLGDTNSDFLRVELKRVSLDIKEPFRGKAPQSMGIALDAVEFTNPKLEVERIVCVSHDPCTIKPSAAPSLIIVFPSVSPTGSTPAGEQKVESGSVKWLPASEGGAVDASAAGPTHMLRILLPDTSK